MKKGFYAKLAADGMRKNRRLYLPYILTCGGMVLMYYIIAALSKNPCFGDSARMVLSLGKGVMAVFALIFLFYTNSFLVRRRKKEFGLYNILGMGKRNIARILFWETLLIAVISLAGGLLGGIVLCKLAELELVHLMNGLVTYSLSVNGEAVYTACILFAVIFLLIFLNTLRQVHFSNPISLLHSESTGEKPPRSNWVLAVLGALALGTAYYIAVSIKDPLGAVMWFFVAVILVIIGTYLLFIAGSVVFCRLLQKKKSYYYKKQHFVSVSSMVYRMKRNGAGLASICILGTMVLVMLSSTASLYFGAEDSLRSRYPRNISTQIMLQSIDAVSESNVSRFREVAAAAVEKKQANRTNVMEYRMATIAGVFDQNGRLETNVSEMAMYSGLDDACNVYFVPLADYNRLMNAQETLQPGEALIYSTRSKFRAATLSVGDEFSVKVKKTLSQFIDNGMASAQIIPTVFVIIDDFQNSLKPLTASADYTGENMLRLSWYYGFDLNINEENQTAIQKDMYKTIGAMTADKAAGIDYYSCECAAAERSDFYATYGSLFFLGILLSIVFLFAAVLMIYYKQISEGYEDQSRFDIMQKVGMTKKEIRRSINSQILTVFSLPLIFAGLHLAFAFPMIHKLLMLFNLLNTGLFVATTLIAFVVFAVFYVLVYRITSNAYYAIVSGAKSE